MPTSLKSLPLSDLKPGEHATLIEIHAGRGALGRMTSLGFTPGVDLEMTQNYGRGPLLVTVRGTRVALGRHEAERLLVQRRGI
jgi:ferrous iron transport protein A